MPTHGIFLCSPCLKKILLVYDCNVPSSPPIPSFKKISPHHYCCCVALTPISSNVSLLISPSIYNLLSISLSFCCMIHTYYNPILMNGSAVYENRFFGFVSLFFFFFSIFFFTKTFLVEKEKQTRNKQTNKHVHPCWLHLYLLL